MTKEKFDLVGKNGGPEEDFEMRLDPQASPPAFTWSVGRRVTFVGSYRLRKDEMTMVLNRGDRAEQRPTDFASKSDFRFILRRIKR